MTLPAIVQPAQVQRYIDTAVELTSEAYAVNTVQTYRYRFTAFEAFCKSIDVDTVPVTRASVCAYIGFAATEQYSVSTLDLTFAAIRHFVPESEQVFKEDVVKQAIDGFRRRMSISKKGSDALLWDDLCKVIDQIPDTFRGCRDKAMILLAFTSAVRRSELVALNVSDITFKEKGILIKIRKSKTDQYGEGQSIAVLHGNGKYCPVNAIRDWLNRSGIVDGALFRAIRNDVVSAKHMTDKAYYDIFKEAVLNAGLSGKLSPHSTRAGFVTEACRKQVPLPTIMKTTRHKKIDTVMKYHKEEDIFNENAGAQIYGNK